MASFKFVSSRIFLLLTGVFVAASPASLAVAQEHASGFAVERLYQSAPGGGWFVMDDLDISGRLGGAISASSGYARNPLVVTSPDGRQKLSVVTQEAFLDIGGAVTYNRFRAYLNIPMPLLVEGSSGSIGIYQFTAPSVTLGTTPDEVSDGRIGVDARLSGQPGSLLRLGAGAQLIFPSGARADYVSDARYRAMFRFLVAGDHRAFTYAGQLGVHARSLNDVPVPGSPNGSEFLYGISGGRRFAAPGAWTLIAGPEIFGETAFHSFFSGETGTEALFTGRLEQTRAEHNLRLKLGVGHALQQDFGAAQWRVVFGIELFGHK